jgi:hypothetical protein
VADDKKADASQYDLPPWGERVVDVTLVVFFVAVLGAATTLIVIGTIVVIRAML